MAIFFPDFPSNSVVNTSYFVLVSFLVHIFACTFPIFSLFSVAFFVGVCVFCIFLHPLTNHKIIFLNGIASRMYQKDFLSADLV